ncbi:HAD family hydrolase [bacterium]|nr:HAD family hydrolase [bacterium]
MIKAIAIDLDDTLLDTSGILAPKATEDAFTYLIKNGLQLDLEQCEQRRIELIKSISHREVFEILAHQYGNEKTLEILPEVIKLFYDPTIPEKLPLMEGARENLDYLKSKYQLYLVTAGSEAAQLQKAASLGITQDFKKIFVVNSLLKKRKKDSFIEIIQREQIEPSQLLCIGNSISSEMADALSIDATACYFEFGEDRGDINKLPRRPQYHIKHHKELIPTCLL